MRLGIDGSRCGNRYGQLVRIDRALATTLPDVGTTGLSVLAVAVAARSPAPKVPIAMDELIGGLSRI